MKVLFFPGIPRLLRRTDFWHRPRHRHLRRVVTTRHTPIPVASNQRQTDTVCLPRQKTIQVIETTHSPHPKAAKNISKSAQSQHKATATSVTSSPIRTTNSKDRLRIAIVSRDTEAVIDSNPPVLIDIITLLIAILRLAPTPTSTYPYQNRRKGTQPVA